MSLGKAHTAWLGHKPVPAGSQAQGGLASQVASQLCWPFCPFTRDPASYLPQPLLAKVAPS